MRLNNCWAAMSTWSIRATSANPTSCSLTMTAEPSFMTDKTPKLLLDAVQAIDLVREFVAGISLLDYSADKMRRSGIWLEQSVMTLAELT